MMGKKVTHWVLNDGFGKLIDVSELPEKKKVVVEDQRNKRRKRRKRDAKNYKASGKIGSNGETRS